MISPNWYEIEQISRERHHPRKNHNASSHSPRKSFGNKLGLVISILILLTFALFYSGSVHSANLYPQIAPRPLVVTSPIVYISPDNVPVSGIGGIFTVQVKVANMPQFNGWDIEIVANSAIINATSVSITGNDFSVNASSGSPFEIVHCVNGIGTGCTSNDRPGIIHSAYGNTAILTGNGLLFTVTYKVVGGAQGCELLFQNDLVSSPSSGNGVTHYSPSGSYGTVTGSGGGGGAGSHLEK